MCRKISLDISLWNLNPLCVFLNPFVSILNHVSLRRGWTQIFLRRLRRREGGESVDMAAGEAGLGDKFALVLQVARRVQNQLGAVSNAAEKVKK